ILFVTNDSPEREMQIIRNINTLHLDGILVSVSSNSDSTPAFEALLNQGMPIVFFYRVLNDIDASKVMQNDYNGASDAIEHLITQGYHNIAHIAGPEHLDFTRQRLNGYLDALHRYRCSVRKEWIIHSGFSQQDGFRDMEQLLALEQRPDAVFAVNDRKAIGAMLALKKHGIAIGSEIGVIGFTDDPVAEIISPTLTTVAEPAYEIGIQAGKLLIKHITRNPFQSREKVLPGKLIIRESTRKNRNDTYEA